MAFISGNDVFVTLPTGYGKSLIFGPLPWVFDEIKGKITILTNYLTLYFTRLAIKGSIVVCGKPSCIINDGSMKQVCP